MGKVRQGFTQIKRWFSVKDLFEWDGKGDSDVLQTETYSFFAAPILVLVILAAIFTFALNATVKSRFSTVPISIKVGKPDGLQGPVSITYSYHSPSIFSRVQTKEEIVETPWDINLTVPKNEPFVISVSSLARMDTKGTGGGSVYCEIWIKNKRIVWDGARDVYGFLVADCVIKPGACGRVWVSSHACWEDYDLR